MTSDLEQTVNQAAYHRLKHEIAEKYPLNRFVAIGNGQVIADAETFDAMLLKLAEIGWNPRDVMVVRAGVFVPEVVMIV
ncbi:MAG TPA: hypothetical protein VG122_07685 [Gemmata sp.]|nr:hypothetical protein [Gemmata sp.]